MPGKVYRPPGKKARTEVWVTWIIVGRLRSNQTTEAGAVIKELNRWFRSRNRAVIVIDVPSRNDAPALWNTFTATLRNILYRDVQVEDRTRVRARIERIINEFERYKG